MATHYEILGVEPDATHQDLRRAYLRQARRHHPDASPGADQAASDQARRKMTRINAAWAVVGDASLRQAYDLEIGVGRTRTPGDEDRPAAHAWMPTTAADEADVDFDEAVEEPVGPRGPADLVVLVPVALFVLSVATFAFSVLMQSPFLMWVAIVLLPVAGLAFVIAPLLVMFTRTRARAKP